MFKPVLSKVDFARLEEQQLPFWKDKEIFQKSVDGRRGGPRFTLYEGPPTANGNPGIHHVLARVFKDVIPRYKAMKGFFAPRIGGWDTHGLPVELEVEKKLGLANKAQIEEYGIGRFNEKCKESVQGYLKNWNAMTERIAYWCDLEHPYVTMDNQYIETVWWTLKQLWDKGLIYQGYKVTPHCPRCGTSLSSHEVAQGYEENTEDPSVYPKFKIIGKTIKDEITDQQNQKTIKDGMGGQRDENSIKDGMGGQQKEYSINPVIANLLNQKQGYLLAWTTTPWTLPGNTALAVAANAEYAVIDAGTEYLVLAADLREKAGLSEFPVIVTLKGQELVGTRYEPLYNPHQYGVERRRPVLISSPGETERKVYQIQEADPNLTYRVIATDFVTMDEGTGIVHVAPAFGEVDFEAGLEYDLDFVQQVDLAGKITGSYSFACKFVKTADKEILADLQARGLLYKSGTLKHTYPFCWRCGTPLLYYAKQTWYIRTTAVKDELVANNEKLNWYPDYIKYGRFGDWLKNNVDWAFSRERYWGTPLPIWRCESCASCECIGSVDELAQKSGLDLKSMEASNLGLHRPNVDEIALNCACGGKMKRVPEVIDCWLDSGDMSIAQYHYPFNPESKTIFEDGRFPADYICEAIDQTRGWFYSLHALSTLLFHQNCFKNVICLGHILDAEGEKMSKTRGNVVDPREVIKKYGADALRWYCLTSTLPGNVKRFSEDQVAEITRRFQLILWNVYSFFVMYANIDNYQPKSEADYCSEAELDKWILSELNQLIMEVDNDLNNYDPTDAGRKIENFVGDLSNWYVRRSRRRFWKSENDTDKISAYNTLYACLVNLTKLLAPFMPFMAEELYQNLVRSAFPAAPESVHLCDFPVADQAKINKQLTVATQLAIKVASAGRAARSAANIKVRQPLAKVSVVMKSKSDRESLEHLKSQVLEELNVKDIEFVDSPDELKQPGYSNICEGEPAVAVCIALTPELENEGMAREIVHRLQNMRKAAGFEIADHISTYYESDDYIQKVMSDTASLDYIRQETLSGELKMGIPAEGVYTEDFKLGGHPVRLGVKKIV